MCWYKEIGVATQRKAMFTPSPQKEILGWPSNCVQATDKKPKITYIPRIESFDDC